MALRFSKRFFTSTALPNREILAADERNDMQEVAMEETYWREHHAKPRACGASSK
jgi:hypothetical protein